MRCKKCIWHISDCNWNDEGDENIWIACEHPDEDIRKNCDSDYYSNEEIECEGFQK